MYNRKKVAFVLAGGGSRGAYQCGAWQALTHLNIRPDIVVGTSVGSINGVMIAQDKLELSTQLWREFETDMIFDVNKDAGYLDFSIEFIKNKGAGTSGLQEKLKYYVDEELLRNSPIDFGLVTVELATREARYFWKEDMEPGKVGDYITASCSAYPAVHSHEINGIEYIDGGHADNMPIAMARDKNPDMIIAISLNCVGVIKPYQPIEGEEFILISPKVDLGNFLVFDRERSRKLIKLGYFDTLKAFNILDGDTYTFAKGSWDKKTTSYADLAAKAFDLPTDVLYTKESFVSALAEKIETYRNDLNSDWKEIWNSVKSKLTVDSFRAFVNGQSPAAGFKGYPVLSIVDSFKEKGTDSIFSTKEAMRFMGDEIKAARFILKYIEK